MKTKNSFRYRMIVLLVLLLMFFSVCSVRLFQFCVVNGEEYYTRSLNNRINNVTIPAARGDILDRNGNILATTSVVFNIAIDYNYLPKDKQNDILLKLVKLMEKQGVSFIDEIPVSTYTPYEFKQDSQSQIDTLLDMFKLNVYATAQNVVDEGIKKYSLEGVEKKYQRILLGIRYTMELKEFSRYTRFVFAQDIPVYIVALIKELSNELLGVIVVEEPKRIYKSSDVAAHIIGSVGPIYAEEYQELKDKGYKMNSIIGKSGIEKEYEQYLQGQDGTMQIVQGPDGEIIQTTIIKKPKAGHTVTLTIDMNFQKEVQGLVKKHIEDFNKTSNNAIKSKGGASVVLDPRTGEVLATVSEPGYDINDYNKNYSSLLKREGNPLFNRALFGLYRPGSTFKTIVGTAGLNEGIVNPSSLINCTGTYLFYDDYQPKCLRHNHAGNINVVTALKWSCNIFFYDVGRQLKIDRINEYSNYYGLGVDTGLEIPNKIGNLSGPLYSEKMGSIWNAGGNTIQAAIGQMDTNVTPLQMASQAMTIGNKGVRYETHLVKSIKSHDGKKVIYESKPVIASKIELSKENADAVIDGMVAASSIISGEYAVSSLPHEVAVKTGTPQVTTDRFNSTFVAFYPARKPEIAFTVMQEDGDYTNRLVKQIIDAYYNYDEENNKGDK